MYVWVQAYEDIIYSSTPERDDALVLLENVATDGTNRVSHRYITISDLQRMTTVYVFMRQSSRVSPKSEPTITDHRHPRIPYRSVRSECVFSTVRLSLIAFSNPIYTTFRRPGYSHPWPPSPPFSGGGIRQAFWQYSQARLSVAKWRRFMSDRRRL